MVSVSDVPVIARPIPLTQFANGSDYVVPSAGASRNLRSINKRASGDLWLTFHLSISGYMRIGQTPATLLSIARSSLRLSLDVTAS